MERILGPLDRRTFLSAGGAFALSLGGLSALGADAQASSVSPECPVARLDPRRALKPLAVNRVTVKVGAAKPYAATQANFPNDLTFAARVVNGVNFVAIDDVFYYTTERQAELFEREVAKGLPIVLLCHVPLYSPELFKVAFKKWRTAAYLCGVLDGMMSRYKKRQVEQQRADKTTTDFVSRLRSEPLLKAILCGHIHTTAFDRVSPTACSYVAGANFTGEAQMVTFI